MSVLEGMVHSWTALLNRHEGAQSEVGANPNMSPRRKTPKINQPKHNFAFQILLELIVQIKQIKIYEY